jgi:IclR family acetate operon transcriptional repressor
MMGITMSPEESPDTNGSGDTKGTSVIVNAIAVLRSFTADEPLLGVTEIANRVGLHKSTVSRILSTFEQEHLVERDPETRRFHLGLGLIAVAGPLLAELEERRVAYPVLRELTEQTGETSALMVWNGTESMCVEQIASHQQIKHTTPLGARYQDAMSASVQVFLSAEPVERVRALLRSGTVTFPGLDDASLDGYQIKLGDVARRGWAINYGESSIDEVGVAAPVYDHRGDIVAAVLIPAPRFRVSRERLQSLGEACAAAAQLVTTRLGGRRSGSSGQGQG